MIMGTHGHLLSLRMQSLVGDVNLLGWNFHGFNVCWIQPLLDSSFVGSNLWWIQGRFIQWQHLLCNCCWHYIELMSSVAGFNFCWMVGITQKISLDSTYASLERWEFVGFNFCWIQHLLDSFCCIQLLLDSPFCWLHFDDSHHFSRSWGSLS